MKKYENHTEWMRSGDVLIRIKTDEEQQALYSVFSDIQSKSVRETPYPKDIFPYVRAGGKNIISCVREGSEHVRRRGVLIFTSLISFLASPIPEKEFEEKIILNGRYSAIVTKDEVTVGCQTFSHTAIENLYYSIKRSQKE